MGLLVFSLVSLAILAVANAKPLTLEDGWAFVPDRSGMPIPVNIMTAMEEPQLFFAVEGDVTFELYTLQNTNKPQIISPLNTTTVTSSYFNKTLPTRIYIHGWQEYAGNMKKCFNEAFLAKAKKNVNLIAVNWEKSSQTLNYIAARNRVGPIGVYVAALVDFLVKNNLAVLDDITLIGFSLGAHVAGIAGKNIQSGKLPKIVGLDPAGPLFSLEQPEERLDRYDAKYVEIIHTNGAFLGLYDQIGTVSFYPNRGLTQAGCTWDPTGTCSHLRAFKYFAESIYSDVSFYALPCKTFDDMKNRDCKGVGTRMGGEPGNYRTEAEIYYLETNTRSIFARGGSRDM